MIGLTRRGVVLTAVAVLASAQRAAAQTSDAAMARPLAISTPRWTR